MRNLAVLPLAQLGFVRQSLQRAVAFFERHELVLELDLITLTKVVTAAVRRSPQQIHFDLFG